MQEEEIRQLFERVAENAGEMSDDVRAVFSLLVSATLRYRDQIREASGTVLTVQDVRTVLDWLVVSIHTHRLPDTDNAVQENLLRVWLEELNLLQQSSQAR